MHHYSMESILARSRRKRSAESAAAALSPLRGIAHVPGPASVNYEQDYAPQHPQQMHATFHRKLYDYREKHGLPHTISVTARTSSSFSAPESTSKQPGTGRQLFGLEDDIATTAAAQLWDGKKRLHAAEHARLEAEYAHRILEQGRRYEEYHSKRIELAHVMHNSARATLLRHAQTTFRYENIFTHWDATLKRFGYHDIWDVYNKFSTEHGTALAYLASASERLHQNDAIQFLAKKDPRRHEHPFFHEWLLDKHGHASVSQARTALSAAAAAGKLPEQALVGAGSGNRRKLLQSNARTDLDENGRFPVSEESGFSFEMLSETDCFSAPRNPLCMPEIPPDFEFELGQIPQPELEDGQYCPPWRNTNCILCMTRVYNTYQSVRFLISAIPPINFFLTFFLMLVPWMGWAFNWVFLVKPGEFVTFFQASCFVKHLYDVFIVLLVTYLAVRIFLPLAIVLIRPIVKIYLRDRAIADDLAEREQNTDKENERLNRIWTEMTTAAEKRWHSGHDWRPHPLRTAYPNFHWYGGVGIPYDAQPASVDARLGTHIAPEAARTDDARTHPNINESHDQRLARLARQFGGAQAEANWVRQQMATLLRRLHRNYHLDASADELALSAVLTDLHHTHALLSEHDEPNECESVDEENPQRQNAPSEYVGVDMSV